MGNRRKVISRTVSRVRSGRSPRRGFVCDRDERACAGRTPSQPAHARQRASVAGSHRAMGLIQRIVVYPRRRNAEQPSAKAFFGERTSGERGSRRRERRAGRVGLPRGVRGRSTLERGKRDPARRFEFIVMSNERCERQWYRFSCAYFLVAESAARDARKSRRQRPRADVVWSGRSLPRQGERAHAPTRCPSSTAVSVAATSPRGIYDISSGSISSSARRHATRDRGGNGEGREKAGGGRKVRERPAAAKRKPPQGRQGRLE